MSSVEAKGLTELVMNDLVRIIADCHTVGFFKGRRSSVHVPLRSWFPVLLNAIFQFYALLPLCGYNAFSYF